jgi:hypothetical protein
MRLREFEENSNNTLKLAALSQFLNDRADDEAAPKQISQRAFIQLAQSLGVNVTEQSLASMIDSEPLSAMLEPYDPTSGVIKFKGNTETTAGMSVDQARTVVDSNAKSAMKRRQ